MYIPTGGSKGYGGARDRKREATGERKIRQDEGRMVEGKDDAIFSRIPPSQKLLCLRRRFQRKLYTSSSKILLVVK